MRSSFLKEGVEYLTTFLKLFLERGDIDIEDFWIRGGDDEDPNMEIRTKDGVWVEIAYLDKGLLEVHIESDCKEAIYLRSIVNIEDILVVFSEIESDLRRVKCE